MKVEQKTLDRFNELLEFGDEVLQTKFRVNAGGQYNSFSYDAVENSKSYQWGMKCLSTLEKVFGTNSRYYAEFNDLFNGFDSIQGYEYAKKAFAVLKAAKDDYEDGYIINHIQEENIKISDVNDVAIHLTNKCNEEAKRNTRIYLIIIFEFLVIISMPFFYFFGVKYASLFTIAILVVSYILSFLFLKEVTPTKLHERLLEYEQNRLCKRFGIDKN